MARHPENSENKVSETFKKRLISLIAETDYNRKEFASFVGLNKEVLTRATLYGIIPGVRSLIIIADKLEIGIEYLLGDSDDRDFYPSQEGHTFHSRLTELAAAKEINFSALASQMPFAHNSIYEWMRTGGLPSLDYLKALAVYFDVSVDYLLGRTDDRK